MKTLTIFTPAYNRRHTIGRTYQSLLRQTSSDFEWLIIDDGSTDDTESLVRSWIDDGKITIRYVRQDNQGMHGAHNTAYSLIRTELNVCIDSDDWMPDDAVEAIVAFWRRHGSDKVAGILGLDARPDGSIIGSRFLQSGELTTLQGFYAAGGTGDKKLVYRTEVVRRYPDYPLFEGEKYVGLAYKYMLIDQDLPLLTLNRPLVIVDYQPDGSSASMYGQYWRNPRGFAFYRRTEMQFAPTLKRRFISCVHYVASSIIARNRRFLNESPKKMLTFAAILPGILWFLRIRSKVRSGAKMKV